MKSWLRLVIVVSIAWSLLVCYSIFVKSAILSFFVTDMPDIQIDLIIFLYGLAVISFLGGSQIPAVLLGRRSFLIQFAFACAFGLILYLTTGPFEPLLDAVRQTPRQIFSNYPLLALEYLSLPYLFMVFLDIHSYRRLEAFSWSRFRRIVKDTILHPRKACEDCQFNESFLLSFIAVFLVLVAWVFWAITTFHVSPGVALGGLIDPANRVALIIPIGLFVCFSAAELIHLVAEHLEGMGSFSELASIIGFASIPTLLKIIVDIAFLIPYSKLDSTPLQQIIYTLGPLTFKFHLVGNQLTSVIFWVLDFFVPLFLWPLLLVAFAVQTSEKLSLKRAISAAIVVIAPLVTLLSWALL